MINKKVCFLLICLFVTLSISSQNKEVFLGLKVGLNYTLPKLPELKSIDYDYQIGIHAGGYFGIRISSKVNILVECLYSSQDMSLNSVRSNNGDGTFGKIEINQKIKEEYLNIPVLFNYKITSNLNVNMGPQFGTLFTKGTRFLVEDGIIYYNEREAEDNFGVSGIVGVNYDITSHFNLGVRYNFGISKINGFRNSVLQTYIGYSVF